MFFLRRPNTTDWLSLFALIFCSTFFTNLTFIVIFLRILQLSLLTQQHFLELCSIAFSISFDTSYILIYPWIERFYDLSTFLCIFYYSTAYEDRHSEKTKRKRGSLFSRKKKVGLRFNLIITFALPACCDTRIM